MNQDELGRCDFLDVLEEAVLRRKTVAVELRSGETFLDRVVDVVTESGDELVVFHAHPRISVGQIVAVTRAEADRPAPRDPE